MAKITRESYARQPKHCAHCGAVLPFEQRWYTYCSRSCAITVNNRGVQRNAAPQTFCPCGQPKKQANTYCAACIAQRVYDPPSKSLESLDAPISRRKLLIRERSHQCEGCGLADWMGQIIPLELHHLDGDADHNTRDNLQLLCPNCHAQTDHYKGAVKGKQGTRQRRRRQRYADGQTW